MDSNLSYKLSPWVDSHLHGECLKLQWIILLSLSGCYLFYSNFILVSSEF